MYMTIVLKEPIATGGKCTTEVLLVTESSVESLGGKRTEIVNFMGSQGIIFRKCLLEERKYGGCPPK